MAVVDMIVAGQSAVDVGLQDRDRRNASDRLQG
jgi:hypothetical protein